MGILTAQNDSVINPSFGKHTIGVNVTPLLTGKGISLQYRRTQDKLHFRSSFDCRLNRHRWSTKHVMIVDSIGDPSDYYMMNNWHSGFADYKLRMGVEKQLKLKKINAFVGADLIIGYRDFVELSSKVFHSHELQEPYVVRETDIIYPASLILGADVTFGVEFYLTKRLNLTTQLTFPICFNKHKTMQSHDQQAYIYSERNILKLIPSLDINLSYKFGGFKKQTK